MLRETICRIFFHFASVAIGLMMLVVSLSGIISLFSQPLAHAQDDLQVQIDSPRDGQELFGVEQIRGSAAHPTAFDKYTLEYKDLGDPNAPWLLVQAEVRQQVFTDVLGNWTTTVVPDGVYALRLRVFLRDGQVGEFVVTGLRIANNQGTPVPTTPPEQPAPDVVEGDSDTAPVIEQPPGAGPQVSSVTGLDAPASSSTSSSESETRINTGRVRTAFCSGVYVTLGAFGLMVLYLMMRGRIRPYTRRLLWQTRDDYQQPPE